VMYTTLCPDVRHYSYRNLSPFFLSFSAGAAFYSLAVTASVSLSLSLFLAVCYSRIDMIVCDSFLRVECI